MNAPAPKLDDARSDARRDLREEILRVSTELFANQGYASTSIREVAEACGCTKPALYYYFDNKETLYKEVVRARFGEMSKMIEATLHDEGTLRERVQAGCRAFFRYIEQNPSVIRLLWRIDLEMRAQPDEVVREFMGARELHMGYMKQLFEQGIAAGEIRREVDPEDCAVMIAGTIDFHLQLSMCEAGRAIERIDSTLDLLFDGIAKR